MSMGEITLLQQLETGIALENAEIGLMIRPDLGGRIDQLVDHQTGHEWLWHSPQYDPSQTRNLSVGASFDENWSGGWDEIFPNDAAGEFQGRNLVDHGELWSQQWEIKERSQLSLTLGITCQTVPVRVEKSIVLDQEHPSFQIHYRFENLSDEGIPFLFKHHAAIAIEAGDEILLPDCDIEPVELGFSRIIGQAGKTRFPNAIDSEGNSISLQQTPARSSLLQEFFYSSELAAGECGVKNLRSRSSLKMTFSQNDFPFVWVFQSYGGWQGHYVLVMEPCTTMPYDLEVARRRGSIAELAPHELQSRSLTITLERF
jgi:galactose mutarotase-like enzyme